MTLSKLLMIISASMVHLRNVEIGLRPRGLNLGPINGSGESRNFYKLYERIHMYVYFVHMPGK